MKPPLYLTVTVCAIFLCQLTNGQLANHPHPVITNTPKIQVALLLDVSNSMDGLINQAKDQLWNTVKLLGRVSCNGVAPAIEIALYEYGRSSNEVNRGYIKQILPFTNDLDKLSKGLYGLTTNGGDEYCAHVIKTSVEELNWDANNISYKVIFIAGNESFLQGEVPFTEACDKAKQKSVIVNTIFCGSWELGKQQNWMLGAECGNGTYINIDQNAKEPTILTPYDSAIYVLNNKMRTTLVPYGKIPEYDSVPTYDIQSMDKVIGLAVVRADKNLYNRRASDLVDAMEKDSTIIEKITPDDLPDSLKMMSRNQLRQLVNSKFAEREIIRAEIKRMDKERDAFIQKVRSQGEAPLTLQSEIEKIIRKQISRFNMKIEYN